MDLQQKTEEQQQSETSGTRVIICIERLVPPITEESFYEERAYSELQNQLKKRGWVDEDGDVLRPHSRFGWCRIENGQHYMEWRATLTDGDARHYYNPSWDLKTAFKKKGWLGVLGWVVQGF